MQNVSNRRLSQESDTNSKADRSVDGPEVGKTILREPSGKQCQEDLVVFQQALIVSLP